METPEFLLTAHLKAEALEAWIDAGWLAPRDDGEGRHFSEVDLARVQLIHDLHDLGVNDDAIPVILDLVDQLHGLRRVLRDVLSTVAAQAGTPAAQFPPVPARPIGRSANDPA